jgi:hypothetical protein
VPKVGSDIPDSDRDISLSDGARTYYFNVEGDPPQVDEHPQTPSTLIVDKRGSEFGDWDPQHSHIQQNDWQGGRAQRFFHDDPSRFFDSSHLWTFTPDHVHPAPQWRFAEGYISADNLLQGAERVTVGNDVLWKPLLDQVRYSRKFTASANYTATTIQVWLRKRGQPTGTLTVAVYSDTGGEPNAALDSATVAASDFADEVSVLQEFTISEALSSATVYHIVVYDSVNEEDRNHFEVGYSNAGQSGDFFSSSDAGSTWDAEASIQIMFRIGVTPIKGLWRLFYLEGALYAVADSRVATELPGLMINGDRGIATAGAASTLTDSAKSWTTNVWADAWVRITKGVGIGQYRQIASNTSTVLTVDVAWDTTPTSTSEYIIYATDIFTLVTPATDNIDKPVKTLTVFKNQLLLGFGDQHTMTRIKWNSATPGHTGRDESNTKYADHLVLDHDRVDGPQVWRAENDVVDVSVSDVKDWGTDMAWGTEVDASGGGFIVTGLLPFEGKTLVFKEDSIGYLEDGKFRPLNIGLDSMALATNGLARAIWNLYLYFGWSYSMEQMQGTNLDDVGPWLHAGLPSARRGTVSHLLPVSAIMFEAIDAGTDRTSSVLGYNKLGHGEIYRAWKSGARIQNMIWQSCPGTQDRLWVSVGGNIVVMNFPDESLNMLNDSDVRYHHESILETSTINMRAFNIPKLFKEISVTTKNLDNETYIISEYQVDDEIEGTLWHEIGDFRLSDFQELEINEGHRRNIRLRFRFMTEDSDQPPLMRAWVLEAFARSPVKYQWTMRALSKGLTRDGAGELDVDPSEFIKWLKFQGGDAGYLIMRSKWSELDNQAVLVEPPGVFRTFQDRLSGRKGAAITLAIREA